MTDTAAAYPDCLPTAGSIGLVKVQGVTGDLIRLGQLLDGDGFEDFEHAFVLYVRGDSLESSMVVEAEVGGVRTASLAEYRGREVLWLPCPSSASTAMQTSVMTYLGVPYSFTDYAAIAAHHLRLPVSSLLEEIVKHSHHVICSQLAAACAEKAGWELAPVDFLWPGLVTPGRLAKWAPAGDEPVLIQ